MFKSVFKEIIIVLLLCVAILFVLGILFYDYNPINKVVPNKIAYNVPENIKNELSESVENALSVENKVYTIEGSDLNIYKKSKTYNPSKENPFASTADNEVTANTVDGKNNVEVKTNSIGKNTNTGNAETKVNTTVPSGLK